VTASNASPPAAPPQPPVSWWASWRVYAHPSALRMLALGFSAGLPLLLVLGTLGFRLREAGIDRSTIGYFSWVGLAYGFKWVWSPLVDRMPLPLLTRWLGRRRSWLLLSQVALMVGIVGMALSNPQHTLNALVGWAVFTAMASATQDIALDAFRIESADERFQAALAATYQTGYRLAMIWSGAGVLWLAASAEVAGQGAYQQAAWQWAYLLMAGSLAVGLLTVLTAPEPVPVPQAPARNLSAWVQQAVVAPFADFFQRHGHHALWVLALIATYRISDVVMGIMANPFYVDMGYTKEEVAWVTKMFGVFMTLAGAFVGGVLSMKLGVARVLMLGAVLSAATNLLFAWLSGLGHNVPLLVAVVSADNLSSGIASAAFIAYLSSLTQVRFSATQYALFSSIMLLLPKYLAGFSGVWVDAQGYAHFFMHTALLGLPVLWLVHRATSTGSLYDNLTKPAQNDSPAGME
jgi:PAT family beta-lactamase induction signal transducer AmpG